MTDRSTSPRCGLDPRAQLTDGDRQAVDSFRAYLADRAAPRQHAEAALAAVEAALGDTLLPAAREEALAGIVAVLPPPTDQTALRELLITALDNAHHTHPCPALGDQTWSGCVHYDDAGRMLGVGVCHSERRADAVLAVLPEPADRATEVEQLRIKNERMRHELEVMYSGAFDSTEPTNRAAVLREAADQYAKLTDQNEAYDREHGELDEDARLRHEVVRDVVTGLRRMADETPAAAADVEHCVHDRAVHTRHHHTPVTGCPWCTATEARQNEEA
jgi:hypothetical protein